MKLIIAAIILLLLVGLYLYYRPMEHLVPIKNPQANTLFGVVVKPRKY